MKLQKIFDLNQGIQITDEEIYYAIPNNGKIPIITAHNEIKGYWDKAIVKETELPCITYPTKGNRGLAFVQDKVFDANNTAILIPFPDWRDKILLDWCAFKLSKNFVQIATSKEGVSYLNKEIVEELELEIPEKEDQTRQFEKIKRIMGLKDQISRILQRIKRVEETTLTIEYDVFQGREIPVSDLFDHISGNSGLTEEYLYANTFGEDERPYRVLTGSPDMENCLYTSKCPSPTDQSKKIRVYCGEGIHVSRNGKAGRVNYLENGKYTLNDHAYILKLKDDIKYKVSLKWVTLNYQKTVLDFSSASDNGTWNMTGFFKNAVFDIPAMEEQLEVVRKFEEISRYEKVLQRNLLKIQELLNKDFKE